ncbi:MAG: hypothetical protein LBC87_10150 [Fibromonadaceae bacterium]|jgi:hypothetical protein|nr:hypothetical protein [Fibromonadaceae bacterium]
MNIVKMNSKAAMLVVMFAIALAFNACSNDNTDDGNQGGNSSSSQGDSSGSNQGGGTPITKLELPEHMQAVIGYGYDANGFYASPRSIKYPILDQDALLAANRILKDVNMVFGEFETITGSDINKYRKELTKKVSVNASGSGVFGLFSFAAEVSKNFGETRIQNSEYVFATTTSNISKGAYHIRNKTGLDAFYTAEFKADLNNSSITAKELVDKYGTHVMLGGIYGARLDHHLSTVARNEKAIDKLGYYVKTSAETKFIFASAGGKFSSEQLAEIESSFETTNTDIKTLVFGGKPEYGQFVNDNSSYNEWINSIEGKEIWSDYYPGSLFGIWELPMDAARSTALQMEVDERCKQINVVNSFPEIIEWKTIRGDGGNDVKTINDDGPLINKSFDVIKFAETFDVNLDKYKEKGYTKITFYIQMDMAEIKDGKAWVHLYSSDIASDSYKIASDSRDLKSDKQWRPELVTFLNVDINSFKKTTSGEYIFVIRYHGSGDGTNDWMNKNVKVKLVFSK